MLRSDTTRDKEVVKWLYKKGIKSNSPVDIHVENEYAFKWSCKNGYAHYTIGMLLILI